MFKRKRAYKGCRMASVYKLLKCRPDISPLHDRSLQRAELTFYLIAILNTSFPITDLALDIERQAVGAAHGREPRHAVLAALVTPGHSLVFSTTPHFYVNSDIPLMNIH